MPQIHDISPRTSLAIVTVLDHSTGRSYRAKALPNDASIDAAVSTLLHHNRLYVANCSASVVKPVSNRKGR